MSIGNLKNIIKRRLLIGFLDVFGFLFVSIVLLSFFVGIHLENFGTIAFPVAFFIYYGLIPSITKGRTLFGYIFHIKIISLNKKHLSASQYALRAAYAIAVPFKSLFYTRVRYNRKGQLYYDKIFDTTVTMKKNIDFLENDENDREWFDYFFLAENVKYIFYFVATVFGLSIVKYILNFTLGQ